MVNYSNGKIYKIECHTTNLVYIGSTTKKYLCSRLSEHTANYRYWKAGNARCNSSAFPVLDANTYSITLLELVDCKTKDELCARERYYIESMECVNKVIPTRSDKERNIANREKRKAPDRERKEKNKERLYALSKIYNETHYERLHQKVICECGGRYSFKNKSTHLKTQTHMTHVASKI